MMADHFAYEIIAIGLAIFAVLIVILAVVPYYGSSYTSIAQGVAQFFLFLEVAIIAIAVLVHLARGRG
jgi:succinate dehydrogenase hydrophobic anchor subunit